MLVVAFLAGAVTWSLLEYLVHYQQHPTKADTPHYRHHLDPKWHAPWRAKVAVGVSLGVLATAPTLAILADRLNSLSFFLGFIAAFALYEVIHFRIHHREAWARRWTPNLYAHHMAHHGKPGGNFGTSTLVWDRLFRTRLVRPSRP